MRLPGTVGCAVVFALLLGSGRALRRDSNVVYFDGDEATTATRSSRSMLADVAHELLRRSASSSQVLNLNLSNLLLLLVLKAVVYGAGFIGNHAFKGRVDTYEDTIMSEGEIALALGYLIGDTCLYRAACEVPHTAKDYLGAAEMIFETMKLMPQIIPIDESTSEKTIAELQKAIDLGLKGQCPSEYNCKKDNIHRFLRPQQNEN